MLKKIKDGVVNIDNIDSLTDEEIIKELIKVKGIDKCTAEMFLIFSLGRMDVFSLQNLGIKKAVQGLYIIPELPNREFLINFSNNFKPYRTVVTIYLWGGTNKVIIKWCKYIKFKLTFFSKLKTSIKTKYMDVFDNKS